MRYKLFGKSGLRVSEMALGTMTFGGDWGWGASKEESKKIFDRFAEAGGNFIDTANRYTEGTSERFVGEFVAADRDYFVVATKYTLFMRRDDPNASGNHRKNMVRALEASLKRLNTDYVDIYWVHAWDFMTPVEEVMRALDDMIRAGKVLYIGISDTPAWIVSRANTMAEHRGWTPFTGLQTQYSLVERTSERDLLPMTQHMDMAITAWGALGSGVLTGKYNRSQDENGEKGRVEQWGGPSQHQLDIATRVIEVAEAIGASPSQVALSWVRQQGRNIIPLIGARKLSQINDNLGSLNVTLEAEHLDTLNQISHVDRGFPHDFLASESIRDTVYGGMRDRIDAHNH